MDKSVVPNLQQLHQRLAADNSRIDAAVDYMLYRMQHLVEASLANNWHEVEQIARRVAHSSEAQGQREIAIHATQLYELVAGGAASPESIRAGVARLVAKYRPTT